MLQIISTYCNSRYGCELWSLDNRHINEFGTAWRKAVRRVLKLPPGTHNSLIPLLWDSLPFVEDICKRSARFIVSCLQSQISVVRSVARFGVLVNHCVSPLGRNALFCCSNFGWRSDMFVNGDISLANNVFLNLFHQSVSESDWLTVHILRQVLNILEGTSFLLFSDGSTLLRSELDSFILSLATDRVM